MANQLFVVILLGGLLGPDGYVTSSGLTQLAAPLQERGAQVEVYQWGNYKTAGKAIKAHARDRIVVIGYSGGGSRATWLANDGQPRIDKMVLYDPSPRWQMLKIPKNVKQALCYHSTQPGFFGLGGGVCRGPNVKSLDIAENHMLIQFDQTLHKKTLQFITRFVQ